MHSIRAFCFDVFGTVVNWREGVAAQVNTFLQQRSIQGIDPYNFADEWRSLYQPAMQACRSGQRPYVRLDILHRENLEALLRNYQLAPSQFGEHALDELSKAWHRLDPWPDSVAGLTRLKSRYIIGTASNGNIALMVNMAKRAGLPWDVILGAEVTQAYKPSPEAYTRMLDILGLEPTELCMVAAHNDDLQAAQACGLRTAFIPRPTEHGPEQTTDLQPEGNWSFVATDLTDLARLAGC
jgi:2-haloacid dehalogenase